MAKSRLRRCRCNDADAGEIALRGGAGEVIGYQCRRCGLVIDSRCPFCRRGPFQRLASHYPACTSLRTARRVRELAEEFAGELFKGAGGA